MILQLKYLAVVVLELDTDQDEPLDVKTLLRSL